MKVVNLTGHDVTLLDDNGDILKTFESMGKARIIYTAETYGWIEETDYDIEVLRRCNTLNFDGVEIEPYTVYIVSYIFLRALKEHNHPQLQQFVAPNTLNAQMDEQGNVLGVVNFIV